MNFKKSKKLSRTLTMSVLCAIVFGGGTALPSKAEAAEYYYTIGGEQINTAGTPSTNMQVAIGEDVTASGEASVAMGYFNTSSGMASVAMGMMNAASGIGATAFGYGNWNDNGEGGTSTVGALGDGSFVTGGYASYTSTTELGNPNTASGRNAVAMGEGNTASGIDSFAIGKGNTASNSYSVAMGYQSTASGDYSVAMGGSNTASNLASVAMGMMNTASNSYSVAMGINNISSGSYSVAMGASNTASDTASIAMGASNTASNEFSVAIGNNNTASGKYSVAMGNKNTASGSESVAMGNKNTASGTASVAMGALSKSSGMASVAMGAFTNAKGMGSVAFGWGGIDTSTGSAKETVGALGDGSFVTGGFVSFDEEEEESIITNPNTASGRNAVAMGEGNTASGIDSFAIGKGNTASGNYSVAMGQSATATPDNSFAFGGTVASGHTASVALGYGSVTGGAYEVSVGSSTQTRKITNVTAGTADTDAVNYSQLKGAYTSAAYSGTTLTLTKIDGTQTQLTIGGGGGGGGSFFEADGNDVKLSTQSKITNVAAGTNAYDAVNYSQLKNLEGRLTQDIGRTGAASAALASLHPQMMRKGESQVMAGMGRYHGKSGAAVGLAWQPHKRIMLSGGFADAAGEIMFNFGASYKFGQHSYTAEQLAEINNGTGLPLYVAELNAVLKSKDVQIMNLKSEFGKEIQTKNVEIQDLRNKVDKLEAMMAELMNTRK